eukprot:scaffold196225_cov67-Attheya_sp.AAC.1
MMKRPMLLLAVCISVSVATTSSSSSSSSSSMIGSAAAAASVTFRRSRSTAFLHSVLRKRQIPAPPFQLVQSADASSSSSSLAADWRTRPDLQETLELPSLKVPQSSLHLLLRDARFRPFLASSVADIHPRLKNVADLATSEAPTNQEIQHQQQHQEIHQQQQQHQHKLLLFHPETAAPLLNAHLQALLLLQSDAAQQDEYKHDENGVAISFNNENCIENRSNEHHDTYKMLLLLLQERLMECECQPGPTVQVRADYTVLPVDAILQRLLPPDAHPTPTSYEQVGHVVHLNLNDRHLPYRHLIGSVMLEKLQPHIRTVVNKVGQVSGPHRTYEMELLAGDNSTNVKLVEQGIALEFDLANVYWCSRLAGERQRLIQDEFHHGQVIADAFCGAGALCVLAAKQLNNITIVANDLNPYAVQYAKQNAHRNGLSLYKNKEEDGEDSDKDNDEDDSSSQFHVVCGDARDFLVGLGVNEDRHAFASASASASASSSTPSTISSTMDSMPEEVILPHHVVMNYPLDSAGFLDALRWWPTERPMRVVPNIHLYTFARADNNPIRTTTHNNDDDYNDDDEEPRTAMEVAIDMVADGLLPEYIATKRRAKYLNQLGCQVRAREVRLVAPGKMVIRVSFRVTRSLIRTMRGDFFEEDDHNDDENNDDDSIIMEDE